MNVERHYVTHTEMDVLFARGGIANKNRANIRLLDHVATLAVAYKRLTGRGPKMKLSLEVVKKFRGEGNRLLKRDKRTNQYYELDETEAARHVSQRFRDAGKRKNKATNKQNALIELQEAQTLSNKEDTETEATSSATTHQPENHDDTSSIDETQSGRSEDIWDSMDNDAFVELLCPLIANTASVTRTLPNMEDTETESTSPATTNQPTGHGDDTNNNEVLDSFDFDLTGPEFDFLEDANIE